MGKKILTPIVKVAALSQMGRSGLFNFFNHKMGKIEFRFKSGVIELRTLEC